MKIKNGDRQSIWNKINENEGLKFILLFVSVTLTAIGIIMLILWLNGDLRSYEQKLQDYRDAKALCLETGLENDQCTIFAWKESGLDNE